MKYKCRPGNMRRECEINYGTVKSNNEQARRLFSSHLYSRTTNTGQRLLLL